MPVKKPAIVPNCTMSQSVKLDVSQTFMFTGSFSTFEVPSGVSYISVSAYGAQGGSTPHSIGGLGGYISSTVHVIPGQTLYVYVGGSGSIGSAGFNGGGSPDGMCARYAAGGGGSTDIRTLLDDNASRLVVAGGGGGVGHDGGHEYLNGGREGGTMGLQVSGHATYSGGTGGNQTNGGFYVENIYSTGVFFSSVEVKYGGYGSLRSGGVAGESTCGGGGGGGYYGGGDGAWTAGGGGSSYSLGGMIHRNFQSSNAGNGLLINCYQTIGVFHITLILLYVTSSQSVICT
jgi:Glycine rich protein